LPSLLNNSIHNVTPDNQNKEEMKIYQNISNISKWTGSVSVWKRPGKEGNSYKSNTYDSFENICEIKLHN